MATWPAESMSVTPEVQRAAMRWGTSPESSDAGRFLAERVGTYARIIGSLFGGLYVVGIVVALLVAPQLVWVVHKHPAKIANLLVAVLGLSIWAVMRRPKLPEGVILAGDALLPLGVNVLTGFALISVSKTYGMQVVPIMVSVLVLMCRAALVPSPPRRTALIGLVAGVPLMAAEYVSARNLQYLPTIFTPFMVAIGASAWSVVVAIATALVSREIYGLRREIARARRLGQYTLESLIGEGGMGSVYRARHALLRRPTAIKLLLPDRAGPESIARFEREVQLTSSLTHPNTVAIYDYGRTDDGVFYYAMEYIDGLSLEELVQRYGPQPAARVVHVLMQALDALEEAHDVGLVHRDVKPANILLCRRGTAADVVKLVDFGLVKNILPSPDPALTHAQALAGTPLYLAPESLTAPEAVDRRVDLYALGAVAYYLLTGLPPFEGKTAVEVCGHHLHTAPTPPSERLGKALPKKLEALVLACLAKEPGARPQTAAELHRALEASLDADVWSRKQAADWWREHQSEISSSR